MTTTNTPAIATTGLSAQEAQERLRRYGPNAVPEERPHPLLLLLHKFWSPVPWMLEATLLLELVLGKYTQAVIIAVLLVLNAVLSFLQERRASNALQLLRQHLTVQARVLRDGRWQLVLAQDLVPGDVVHVRMGDLAPADVLLRDGQILVDQSALTGESAPVEVGPGNTALCRQHGAAWRGHRGSRRNGTAYPLRQDRRVGADLSHAQPSGSPDLHRRQVPGRPGPAAGRSHPGLCRRRGHPPGRDHPLRPDPAGRLGPGGAAGDLHAGERPRLAGTRQAWRAGDSPLCRRGGGGDGRVVQRQDRHDHEEPVGGGGVAALRLSLGRRTARTGRSRL